MRESFFTADFFVGNRKRLRELFTGTAPIVITAHGALQKSGDVTFDFRQDSSFWYLTGISVPDAILVMDKGKEYIILPEYHDLRAKYDGTMSNDSIIKTSGIDDILDYKNGWKRLAVRVKKAKHIALLAPIPAYVPGHAFYANPARATLVEKLKTINPGVEPLDLRRHLTQQRMLKQVPELHAIETAITITEKSLQKVLKKGFSKFSNEQQIAAEIDYQFKRSGATGSAFVIVSAGPHACIIHRTPDRAPLPQKGQIVLDIGAEFQGYAADISRTTYIGTPTKRFEKVYQAVRDVHEHALGKIRPGTVLRDYEEEVILYMGEKLRELGLIKSVSTESVRRYYNHYTSHFLGLDAHDAGDYSHPLEQNMVITVEPGIYIPEEGIGIRIENDVLITKDGHKVLSSHIPY